MGEGVGMIEGLVVFVVGVAIVVIRSTYGIHVSTLGAISLANSSRSKPLGASKGLALVESTIRDTRASLVVLAPTDMPTVEPFSVVMDLIVLLGSSIDSLPCLILMIRIFHAKEILIVL